MEFKDAAVAGVSAFSERTARVRLRDLPPLERRRMYGFFGYAALLTLLFSLPLIRLMLHALQTPLQSHIVLIPLIAGYLLHIRRELLPPANRTSIGGAIVMSGIALTALAAAHAGGPRLTANDDLAVKALAFVCLVAAGGFLFFGSKWMTAAAFPFAFLLFMVPLPDGAANWLEVALMRASADAAALFFNAVGTPLVRRGTVLELPRIVLQVTEECSGIRSSWVLFITSLLASDLFLKSPWRRIVLVAFVIPLGILRNGFRILVIGLLCVHVGPHMIDSVIHHRGGPLFFALSLVPLFLLMWWLRRGESRMNAHGSIASKNDA